MVPAGLGVAHAPRLKEGALALAGLVRASGLADEQVKLATLDVDVVVTCFHQGHCALGGAAGQGRKRSLDAIKRITDEKTAAERGWTHGTAYDGE